MTSQTQTESWRRWGAAFLVLGVLYGVTLFLYAGKYQPGGNAYKYDVSAEVFKRLLFTGDIQNIDAYLTDTYGKTEDSLAAGFGTAITDERPLLFFYLAALKLVDPAPVMLHFSCGILFLLGGLLALSKVLYPKDPPLFFLLSGLLLSPYCIHEAYIYEPHAMECLFTCLALTFYIRERTFTAFFFAMMSVFAHPGNLVWVGCLGLHQLYTHRLDFRAHVRAAAGGLVALALVECAFFVLFSRDQFGVLPHIYMTRELFFKSDRMHGNYALGSGPLALFKSALVLMPLGTIGFFWVRDKLQFSVTVLPLLVYAVATKLAMLGAFRVLMPLFFLGHAYFFRNALQWNWRPGRIATAALGAVILAVNIHYMTYVAGCLPLDTGGPVAVAANTGLEQWRPEDFRLYWNLRRFQRVEPGAPVVYDLKEITRLDVPNVPDAESAQVNFLFRLLARVLPADVLTRIGSLRANPPIFSVVVRPAAAPAAGGADPS
jgi:hypothetical protein